MRWEQKILFNDNVIDNTFFLSGGDIIIPSPFYSASSTVYGVIGIGDMLIQNACAFGNHEFDSNTLSLSNLINGIPMLNYTGTAFPYLSCNLDFTPDTNMNPLQVARYRPTLANKITSSVVFTIGGEKIGVVGATTPSLRTISSPGNVIALPQPFAGTQPSEKSDKDADESSYRDINQNTHRRSRPRWLWSVGLEHLLSIYFLRFIRSLDWTV